MSAKGMDTATTKEEIAWCDRGIFNGSRLRMKWRRNFLSIRKVIIVSKKLKRNLALVNVSSGLSVTRFLKTYGWKLKVAFCNPSNWVLHLLVILAFIDNFVFLHLIVFIIIASS